MKDGLMEGRKGGSLVGKKERKVKRIMLESWQSDNAMEV